MTTKNPEKKQKDKSPTTTNNKNKKAKASWKNNEQFPRKFEKSVVGHFGTVWTNFGPNENFPKIGLYVNLQLL